MGSRGVWGWNLCPEPGAVRRSRGARAPRAQSRVLLCARCRYALDVEPNFAFAIAAGQLVSACRLCYHLECLMRILDSGGVNDDERSTVCEALAEIHLYLHDRIYGRLGTAIEGDDAVEGDEATPWGRWPRGLPQRPFGAAPPQTHVASDRGRGREAPQRAARASASLSGEPENTSSITSEGAVDGGVEY